MYDTAQSLELAECENTWLQNARARAFEWFLGKFVRSIGGLMLQVGKIFCVCYTRLWIARKFVDRVELLLFEYFIIEAV